MVYQAKHSGNLSAKPIFAGSAAGISCNGSHGRGTARWNPVGAGTEFVLSHNDDSKWLISHYFYTKKTMCNLDFIISPFQFFVGSYTLSRNYPHS